jgi:4-hydroxybenzoate polyprenyltransferase
MTGVKAALYLVAALTCVACMLLLAREYLRTRIRLLLWASLCFVGLTLNNVLLYVDLVLYPASDLRVLRHVSALAGLLFLLYGFIWETES